MYDTIMVNETKCPVCRKYVDLGFQTKAFERNLAVWSEGEFLAYKSPAISTEAEIRPLRIFKDVNAVLTMTGCQCPKCKTFLHADFFIYHSQIIGCLRISDKEQTWASALVDYLTYFLNWEPTLEKNFRYKITKDGKAEKIK